MVTRFAVLFGLPLAIVASGTAYVVFDGQRQALIAPATTVAQSAQPSAPVVNAPQAPKPVTIAPPAQPPRPIVTAPPLQAPKPVVTIPMFSVELWASIVLRSFDVVA